jgi:hypothetical protein
MPLVSRTIRNNDWPRLAPTKRPRRQMCPTFHLVSSIFETTLSLCKRNAEECWHRRRRGARWPSVYFDACGSDTPGAFSLLPRYALPTSQWTNSELVWSGLTDSILDSSSYAVFLTRAATSRAHKGRRLSGVRGRTLAEGLCSRAGAEVSRGVYDLVNWTPLALLTAYPPRLSFPKAM